jgi:sulfur carrier protein
MNIILNGESKTVPDNATITETLQLFNIVAETVVVEHNGTIIQPDVYSSSRLAEEDRLEFIRFVGGG